MNPLPLTPWPNSAVGALKRTGSAGGAERDTRMHILVGGIISHKQMPMPRGRPICDVSPVISHISVWRLQLSKDFCQNSSCYLPVWESTRIQSIRSHILWRIAARSIYPFDHQYILNIWHILSILLLLLCPQEFMGPGGSAAAVVFCGCGSINRAAAAHQ